MLRPTFIEVSLTPGELAEPAELTILKVPLVLPTLRVCLSSLSMRTTVTEGSLVHLATGPDILPLDEILRLEVSLVDVTRTELVLPGHSVPGLVTAAELVHLLVVRDGQRDDHPVQLTVNEGPLHLTPWVSDLDCLSSGPVVTLTEHVLPAPVVLLLIVPPPSVDVPVGVEDGPVVVLQVVDELSRVVGPVLPPERPVALHHPSHHAALVLQSVVLVVVVECHQAPAIRQLGVSLSHGRALPHSFIDLESPVLGGLKDENISNITTRHLLGGNRIGSEPQLDLRSRSRQIQQT